jgi:hypothetical protein
MSYQNDISMNIQISGWSEASALHLMIEAGRICFEVMVFLGSTASYKVVFSQGQAGGSMIWIFSAAYPQSSKISNSIVS